MGIYLIGSMVASSWISRVLALSVINLALLSLIEPFLLCLPCGWQHQCWVYPGLARCLTISSYYGSSPWSPCRPERSRAYDL